jgi:hypothetical protein
VNIVKFLPKNPLVFRVIDLKTAVWRNALQSGKTFKDSGAEGSGLLEWLNGAKIGSKNLS